MDIELFKYLKYQIAAIAAITLQPL